VTWCSPTSPPCWPTFRGQAGAKVLPFILPAPNARALLGHYCTRIRPDTAVSTNDVQALAQHLRGPGPGGLRSASERRFVGMVPGARLRPTVGRVLAIENQDAGRPGKAQHESPLRIHSPPRLQPLHVGDDEPRTGCWRHCGDTAPTRAKSPVTGAAALTTRWPTSSQSAAVRRGNVGKT